MKKRLIISLAAVLIIAAIFLFIAVLINYYQFKEVNKNISFNQPTDFINCVNNCVEDDYIKQKFKEFGLFAMGANSDDYTDEINVDLNDNFNNVKLYSSTYLLGGGDIGRFNYLTVEGKCCELTEENIKFLFAPIKNAEKAKEYYLFNKKLVGGYSESKSIIFSEADYNFAFKAGQDCDMDCSQKDQEMQKKYITTIKKNNNGFLMEIVYFTIMYDGGFFKKDVQIKTNGDINELSEKKIGNCQCKDYLLF